MQPRLEGSILVADDEDVTRKGLCRLIQRTNGSFPVLEASNGLETWEIMRSVSTLSLAFIDIRMPGIDGLTVCEKARAASLATRIVIISGFKEFEYARQALRYGVSDYLLKPVKPSDIVHLIGNINAPLNREPVHDESQERMIIEWVRTYVYDYLDKDLTLAEIAEKLHYTPNYLGVLFKRALGKGFQEYLMDCRLQRAKLLLQDPSLRLSEISERVGYTNTRAFTLAFRKVYGRSPKEYREAAGLVTGEME
ncbi:response regulator transcription factor [Tengunoibacter tsumagoiensis]|uniref:DNA-binding response regulator n=1 Tax=Tengunoibacter tsumagoiensis TaxID=2014871 RepID=A0A402A7K4_9CHLR|nr:response regulator [Tengunoibacter tsumagoiensis]GCE15137.1 DNA-binding response regulator [Tengunoibacter tsumagoiensis]